MKLFNIIRDFLRRRKRPYLRFEKEKGGMVLLTAHGSGEEIGDLILSTLVNKSVDPELIEIIEEAVLMNMAQRELGKVRKTNTKGSRVN